MQLPSFGAAMLLGVFAFSVSAIAQTNIAGTYRASETARLTITAEGESDTETYSGTSDNVVISQTGSTFSFTTADPSSGVSLTRTGTISGNSITSMTGAALGFRSTPGLVVSENRITSGTGTIFADRIELHVVGFARGSFDGVAGRIDVVSDVVFRPTVTNTAPTITGHPANRTVSEGASASFSTSASGTPAPTYRWQRMPSGSTTWATLSNGGSYSGATTSTLTVSGTTAAMSGDQFRCVASNGIAPDATTNAATLTVAAPAAAPTIGTHPVGATVIAGTSATFSISATGNPTPTYQWQRKPSGSSVWANISNGGSYSGATTATLTVSGTTTTMSGDQFRCTASNASGNATSTEAALTVTLPEAPVFTAQPRDVTTAAGRQVSFVAQASGLPVWQWYRRPAGATTWTEMTEGGPYAGTRTDTLLVYVTSLSESEDAFRAVATNAGGSVTSNIATLAVEPGLTFTTFAGIPGSGGNLDGTGSAARLQNPIGLAFDSTGALILADRNNHSIRKITPAGVVTTWISGSAGLFRPCGLAFDRDGTLFLTDQGNHVIRRITPDAVITVFAGAIGEPGTADGTGSAARFNSAANITFDDAGYLYVADQGNSRICRITRDGEVRTIAGGAGVGSADGIGSAARFNQASGIVWDPRGWFYMIDRGNQTVRRVSLDGRVVTLAGLAGQAGSADGTGSAARFNNPFSIAIDAAGAVYVCDSANNTIRKGAWSAATSLLPSISRHPAAAPVTEGGMTSLTVQVADADGAQYRWLCDGVAVPGATSATIDFRSAQLFQAGNYRAIVTFADGRSIVSGLARLSVQAASASNARVMNLSTRALDLTGDNLLIPGFVISGAGTKRILVRAVGPGLHDTFGLQGYLEDPQLTLRNQDTGAQIAANDDWGTSADKAAIIATSQSVGAFTLLESSKDSVLVVDLPAGHYTAPAVGAAGGTGIAMVELYDADPSNTGGARLVNISNRGFVDVGDKIMIPGFVVSSEGSRTFLIRAVGPGLRSTFGLQGILEDPVLTVFNSAGQAILSNDDWDGIPGSTTTSTIAGQVGAFPLVAGSTDAAFVVTLPPGGYTIQATGKAGSTGVALVEVYLAP